MIIKRQFYILRRTKKMSLQYDVIDSMLVCATSATEARKIAAKHYADEGVETWLKPEYSTCRQLVEPDKYESDQVLLIDHRPR